MPNVLTGLIPAAYSAVDVIAREPIGLIGSVMRDARLDRASDDHEVRVPIVPAQPTVTISPGANAPANRNQTITNVAVELTKFKTVGFNWSGEEIGDVNKGPGYNALKVNQIAQALRSLTNEMEEDLKTEIFGELGTVIDGGTDGVFGAGDDLVDLAGVRQSLGAFGAPTGNLKLVATLSGAAALRGNKANLFRVNESGDTDFLRMGKLGTVFGMDISETYSLGGNVAANAGESGWAVKKASGYAKGYAGNIALDTGTGSGFAAGDVIQFTGDGNKINYIIDAITTAVNGSNGSKTQTIRLRTPLAADVADNTVLIHGNAAAHTVNAFGFAQEGVVLAQRLPAMPEGGDDADMDFQIQDPISGLVFDFRHYKQYHQAYWEVGAAWGVKTIRSDYTMGVMA